MLLDHHLTIGKREWEDGWHLFTECAVALRVWRKAGLRNKVSSEANVADSLAAWFHRILDTSSKQVVSSFLMHLWSLWQARDERLWRNGLSAADQISSKAKSVLADWQQASSLKRNHPDRAAAGGGSVNVAAYASRVSTACLKWHRPLRIICSVVSTLPVLRRTVVHVSKQLYAILQGTLSWGIKLNCFDVHRLRSARRRR